MKKYVLSSLMMVVMACGFSSVHAGILEIRVGGGLDFVSPNDLDKNVGALDNPTVFNVDAFINVPFLPIGAGLRYETSKQDTRLDLVGSFVEWDKV